MLLNIYANCTSAYAMITIIYGEHIFSGWRAYFKGRVGCHGILFFKIILLLCQ